MTKGGILTGTCGFLVGFTIPKIFGASTGTAFIIGATVAILGNATFDYVLAPMLVAGVNDKIHHAAKNMNQAQADSLAAQAKSSVFPSDRQQIINLLAVGNYTYKDGKAIKNT